MTTTAPQRQIRWLPCLALALLCHAACSAQTPPSKAVSDRTIEATSVGAAQPGKNAAEKGVKNPFDGEWAVVWCDKSKPDVECGGFNLGLVQDGSRLCGAYDSARVGLSQIDEGGRVLGTADGSTATLAIESERSGGKYAAVALLDQGRLHWKLGETLRKAGQDIDIIAIDERLDRRPLEGDLAAKHEQISLDCQPELNRM